MNRVAFFIDGFNLYHALESVPAYHKYKWLNLRKLSDCFISSQDQITDIFYFTAYTTWNMDKLNRHRIYVRALQSTGIKVVLGAFRRVDQICRICYKQYQTFEEKRTDVNIAITMFQTAIMDIWDTAFIVSGDSDLIPAIQAIKTAFPAKRIGIVIPIGRRAEELKQVSDFYRKIKTIHLATCQFDDTISIGKDSTIYRPPTWK